MSKDYKGYELIKAIRDGDIKENSVIEVHNLSVGDNITTKIKYINRRIIWDSGEFNTGFLCDDSYYFRIIEDEQEIDIQNIKKLPIHDDITEYDYRDIAINRSAINGLAQIAKQLDNKLNKLKEK